jgi:excisionase family DNA binding protein
MSSTAITPTTPTPLGRENYVDQYVAARFLSVEPLTVLRWARAGRLPAHPIGTGPRRVWRFLLSELDAWLRSHVHSTRRPRRPQGESIQ